MPPPSDLPGTMPPPSNLPGTMPPPSDLPGTMGRVPVLLLSLILGLVPDWHQHQVLALPAPAEPRLPPSSNPLATQNESLVLQRQAGWHQGSPEAQAAPGTREMAGTPGMKGTPGVTGTRGVEAMTGTAGATGVTGTAGTPRATSTGDQTGSSHATAGVVTVTTPAMAGARDSQLVAPWSVHGLPRGRRRKAQEGRPASHADGKWAAACLDLHAVPAGMPPTPKFDYCSCAPGQLKSYSSPDLEEWFQEFFKTGQKRGGLKLLLLGKESEQLTKGRMHLAEAMLLAKMMKRALVLTDGQDSTLGFDRAMPMCSYFDTKSIRQFVNWIAEPLLLDWMERYELSVVPLFLLWGERPCDESIMRHFSVSYEAAQTPLYRAIKASVRRGEALCLVDSGQDALASLAQQLRDPKHRVLHQADVIVVMKDGFHVLFSSHHMQKSLEHLQYAPHLQAIATNMALGHLVAPPPTAQPQASQGPPRYVAVQWRMEQTMGYVSRSGGSMEEVLKLCAQGIVASAQESMRALGPGTVLFLASDVDMDVSNDASSELGLDLTSNSFHGLSRSSMESVTSPMRMVHQMLQPVTWRHVEPLFPLLDRGLQGILDKLVCMNATHFLYAPPHCGKGWSSYTLEITEERERRGLPSSSWQDPPS